ncbi:MAG: hypothetical protein EZS28_044415 [Streblomastix strix]|uniref:Uncharacterized protein n=1 Tax=Streblomastix strix TaxID=222440 RepID=A0A5J4TPA3_9EUKA|nr:MAG: hypothetical protein EZS28_044415 [Streblomastix strix]
MIQIKRKITTQIALVQIKLPLSSVFDVIGRTFLKFLPSWEQIGASQLVINGLTPNWRAADCKANLRKVSTKQVFYSSKEEL